MGIFPSAELRRVRKTFSLLIKMSTPLQFLFVAKTDFFSLKIQAYPNIAASGKGLIVYF